MARRDVRALLFATAVLVAGCAQPSTPQPGEPEPPCSIEDLQGKHPCEAVSGGWRLHDITTDGEVALHGGRVEHLWLENVHFKNASRVTLELCACVIEGKGFKIEGVANESIVQIFGEGWRLDGLHVQGVASGLYLYPVGLEPATLHLSNFTMECSRQGIHHHQALYPMVRLLLDDVRISGCEGAALSIHGPNDGGDGPAAVEIVGGNFTGNGYGIGSHGYSRIVVRDSRFEANGVGIYSDPPPGSSLALDVTGSQFVRNGNQMLAQGCGGALTGTVTGSVHDSVFTGNALAIHAVPSTSEEIDPILLDAIDNWWGLQTGPIRHASVTEYVCPAEGGNIAESVNSAVATTPHKIAPG